MSKTTFQRFAFKPLADEARFRAIESKWEPDFPVGSIEHPVPFDVDQYQRSIEGVHRAFAADRDSMDGPRSLLDVPPRVHDGEYTHWPEEVVTREAGLAYVAERNRKSLADNADVHGESWYVLVELGEPMPGPTMTIEVGLNGIGGECRTVLSPLRLVTPTADEICRLGKVSAAVKGGAA